MYRHIKDYEIKYIDVDAFDIIKASALLGIMQESACLSAEELGFGYSVLQPKKIGFVIVNWYIELFRAIKLNDILEIHTWPVKPKRLIVLRDFELFVGGEKIGVATSRWCLIDLNSFSMLPSSVVFTPEMQYNDFRSIADINFKIPEIDVFEPCYVKKISYSDYDHYYHANNTKYADFLMDAFSVDELKERTLSTVRITYVKQSKEGEKLEFYRQRQEDGTWTVEGRVDGERRVQLSVKFDA